MKPEAQLVDGAGQLESTPASPQLELGAGEPLDPRTRGRMESALGSSFANVQIHRDAHAAKAAQRLHAHAYTWGEHVGFGPRQYRPGTIAGDALLAHELAHVQQQRRGRRQGMQPSLSDAREPSGGPEAALERDADRASAGAVARLWNGPAELAGDPGASQGSGLRLQRCFTDSAVAIPAWAEEAPNVGEDNQELVDRVGVLSAELAGPYQAYLEAFRNRALWSMGAPSPMEGALGASDDDISGHGARADELTALLRRHGIDNINQFRREIEQPFQAFFQRYAVQVAFQMLRLSEETVNSEADRLYGDGASGSTALDDMWTELAPVRALRRENERLQEAFNTSVHAATHDEQGRPRMVSAHAFVGPARELQEAQAANEARARQIASGLSPQFPILADDDLTLRVMGAPTREELREGLPGVVSNRLRDIQQTRENLAESPEQVWKLEGVIQQARTQFGVSQGDLYDTFITRKIDQIQAIDTVINTALAALGIVFGLMTAGSGWVLVAGLAGSAVVSGVSAYRNYDDYQFRTTAGGSHFNSAEALTSQDPSLFWLALDIVFFAVDLAAATRLFRAAAPLIREMRAAGATGEEVTEALARQGAFGDAGNFAEGVSPQDVAARVGGSFEQAAAAAGHVAHLERRFSESFSDSLRQLLERDHALLQRVIDDPHLLRPETLAAWEDIARLAPVNAETYDLLLHNPALREALVEFPEAARLLKRCASPCFPPNLTRRQIRQINRLVQEAEAAGRTIPRDQLNELLYQYRDNLDDAIAQIRDGPLQIERVTPDELVDSIPGLADHRAAIEQVLEQRHSSQQIRDIVRHVADSQGNLAEIVELLRRSTTAESRNINHILYQLSDPAQFDGMLETLRFVQRGDRWRLLTDLIDAKVVGNQLGDIAGVAGVEARLHALLDAGMADDAFQALMTRYRDMARRGHVFEAQPWAMRELNGLLSATDPHVAAAQAEELGRATEVYGGTGPFEFDLPGNAPAVGVREDGRIALGSSRADGYFRQNSLLHATAGHRAGASEAEMISAARSHFQNTPGTEGWSGMFASDRDMLLLAERAWQRFGPAATDDEVLRMAMPAEWGRVFLATTGNAPTGARLVAEASEGAPAVFELPARELLVVFRTDQRTGAIVFRTIYPVW
ncbi:MAG: DUF4157 domain-containing protein [Enhygromyxa sp.]